MPPKNLLIIALTALVAFACYSVASKNRYANLFAEAMDVIDRQSLREIPRDQMFVSAMEGMLEDLDEHSMYISGDVFQIFDEDIRQEFGGVGMYVETDPKTNRLIVLAPMPGTPAFEVGLRSGDQIVSIDGVETQGKPRRDAIKLLRGPVGAPVELEIERGDQRLTKTIVRASIPVASAHGDYRDANGDWQFTLKDRPRIGYVRLIQFGEKSNQEVTDAITQIGDDIDGLIIDLRNNSGGLLDVAIEICDMFLPGNLPIVSTRGRDKLLLEEHFSTPALALNPGVPMCILVNRNSASASEIFAGCLQDHGRAVLIGEQSWGKGTVQNVIPIQRGQSALKLTTASYWRPSGKHIDRFDAVSKETKIWGVQPDEGFAIQQTDEDVFANIRARNLRDLTGLVTPEEAEKITELRSDEPLDQPSDPSDPEHDSSNPDDPKNGDQVQPQEDPEQPHVDLPMQRAIEYFQSVLQQRRIAA
jgi:carboxyl-terminal processing protease